MLNAKDLIRDIQERARERQLSTLKQNKPFSSAEPNGETKDDIRFGSAESKRKQEPIQNIDKTPKTNQFETPVHENKELAELAGVSKSTVMKAKKVKREAPEVYENYINTKVFELSKNGAILDRYNELRQEVVENIRRDHMYLDSS
ncbi:hypothetical protein [Staphylococcus simulans]|uniref:Uncharacterized protein n=1 Tax=Staphylococcus simulans UMC-CNS-990 TaxID=1405498 RepID=A0ABP2YVL0_STASI|nr:hypothetical protein [Staphylococcus simulans]ERS93585.1 hypothetical protein SSIM_05145 [Staphylococcus simulans UMC-CNS-990]PTJ29682.1 hypothetical protein BU026_12565 [Staphylococcus simulans]